LKQQNTRNLKLTSQLINYKTLKVEN